MTTPESNTPSGAEQICPYADNEQGKTQQVELMFDNIAPAYDRMNAVMSFGMHRRWRNKALNYARKALSENGINVVNNILDIATGTGDVAIKLAQEFPDAEITGADISSGMLEIARRKCEHLPEKMRNRLLFEVADCLALPYSDNSFDLITVAYGVRNFEHLEQGYAEMLRVLRPGGVVCVIELSRPQSGVTRLGYDIYSRYLIPVMGKFASGDKAAYSYLPESIAAAPQRVDMAKLMRGVGFKRCRWKSLTLGAVTIYIAQK